MDHPQVVLIGGPRGSRVQLAHALCHTHGHIGPSTTFLENTRGGAQQEASTAGAAEVGDWQFFRNK